MDKSRRQLVSPSGKGRETAFVLLAAVLVSIACATLMFLNQHKSQAAELASFQVRAFSALNEKELSVFNGLYTAAIEINEIHKEEEEWLSVVQLEEELLPPFTKDTAWKKNGSYNWSCELRPAGSVDIALYSGHPDKDTPAGSFILLFVHDHKMHSSTNKAPAHAPYEIWYHPSSLKQAPQAATDQGFISAGWKEVIAYSGADEVKRIKG